MNKIFILAGTHEQARTLARWHDMAPSEWTYVQDLHQLRGQRQQTMWCFGTHHFRNDAADIIMRARLQEFKIFSIEDDRYIA